MHPHKLHFIAVYLSYAILTAKHIIFVKLLTLFGIVHTGVLQQLKLLQGLEIYFAIVYEYYSNYSHDKLSKLPALVATSVVIVPHVLLYLHLAT